MYQNQAAQIQADWLQQTIRAVEESKAAKEYQEVFATIIMFPNSSSTDYLQNIKLNHPHLKQQLQKYELDNQVNLSFGDSFNNSLGSSFDSQNSVDESEGQQVQNYEQKDALLDIYQNYNPVMYSKEQIVKMTQSLQKVQKNTFGQKFIDQVYQQYLSLDGKISYQQFCAKLRADLLFLLRKMNNRNNLHLQLKDLYTDKQESNLDLGHQNSQKNFNSHNFKSNQAQSHQQEESSQMYSDSSPKQHHNQNYVSQI